LTGLIVKNNVCFATLRIRGSKGRNAGVFGFCVALRKSGGEVLRIGIWKRKNVNYDEKIVWRFTFILKGCKDSIANGGELGGLIL